MTQLGLKLEQYLNFMVIKTIEKMVNQEIIEIEDDNNSYNVKCKTGKWLSLPIISVNTEMGSTITTCLLTY